MLEGVVDDGLEDQSVPHAGGASEVEHVDGAQGGVGVRQTTGGRVEEEENKEKVEVRVCVCVCMRQCILRVCVCVLPSSDSGHVDHPGHDLSSEGRSEEHTSELQSR